MTKNGTVHVLHVLPGLLPGGMEFTQCRIIAGSAGRDLRHSVVCLKGQPQIAAELGDSVPVYCMHATPNEPLLFYRLRRLARQVRPDVVHALNWGAWPDTVLARLTLVPPPPLIFTFHGLGQAGRMPLRRRLAFRVLPFFTTVLTTVSEGSKRLLVEGYGWPENRMEVIHNGIDAGLFGPPRPVRPDGRIVVGAVGNLRPIKNHALLVRACAELVSAGHDLELRIAGEGPQRKALVELAESLGFGNRLRLAGFVEDIAGFLRDLDAFALPSDSEQHPICLLEAMAGGLACVASDVGGVAEMLEGGRCGKLVPPGQIGALARAIAELASSEPTRRKLGQAARERVCDVYSRQRMCEAYRELYLRVAGRASP